jgi:hypothetical protein
MRSVITSFIYSSGHIGAVIASYSFCSKLIEKRYFFYSLSLFRYYSSTLQLLQFLRLKKNVQFFLDQNSINSRLRLALQRYSDNATVSYNLRISHNALAQWRKVIASKIYRFQLIGALLHHKVIALSKFEPLSPLHFQAALPTSENI